MNDADPENDAAGADAPRGGATAGVNGARSSSTWLRCAWWLLPMLAAAVAHEGSLRAEFVYDDLSAIRDNAAIASGDWWAAAFDVRSPLSNRPLTCLSLVVDRALFGAGPMGHHVGNLLLHLVATVLLVFAVRAVLRAPVLARRFDAARARRVACAAAALWCVHPLTVDAVAYATQRSVLLMAVFALGTFVALLRGERDPRRRTAWRTAAWLCLLAGMASKEEIVALPLLLPLFWRAYVAADWRAVAAEWRMFGAFAATWLLLVACVVRGPHNPTVGYDTVPPATAWEWLLTQAGVVAHYLRAAVWPSGLRGCYDWPIVRELGPALAPGLVVTALVVAAAVASVRRPSWGFLGAWLFLLLAPTSTVLPIVTELAAERRMYLPLFAVVVPAALLLDALGRGRGVALVAALVALFVVTRDRVAVYRDEESFWVDAFAQRDPASRSYVAGILIDNYARIERRRGHLERARDLFAEAAQCEHAPQTLRLHYASALLEVGDVDGARRELQQLAAQVPALGDMLDGIASEALARHRRAAGAGGAGADESALRDALLQARAATLLAPGKATFANTLGNIEAALGLLADAEASLRRALELDPDGLPLYANLAEVLLQAQRPADAAAALLRLCARRPGDVQLRLRLGEQYLQRNALDVARPLFEAVLQAAPGHARAQAALAEIAARRR